MLEENHIAILCFSTEGSCASAHTLTCELVVPVKWVRAPQEGRFMYFRTMCQHLWKKVQCTVLVCLTHAHTLILTQGDGTTNKQQKCDLNASPGNASIRLFCIEERTGMLGLSVGLSKGLESEFWLYCIFAFWPWANSSYSVHFFVDKVGIDDDICVIKSFWEFKGSCT